MVINNFPSIFQSNGNNLLYSNKTELPFGKENIIINARTDKINFETHSAPLSVKLTLKGTETYEFEGTRVKVDSSNFLFLNNGQSYSSYIDSDSEVESFCFFFRDGFIDEIVWSEANNQIENFEKPEITTNFYEKLHSIDESHGSLILSLVNQVKSGNCIAGCLDEIFYLLGENILELNDIEIKRSYELNYEKKSTREEVYRRLCRCIDFIRSNYSEQVTLDDISRASCLSKYYLIKIFKSYFGITPFQYLSKCRLDKAKELIENTEMNISQVVLQLGFENLSSFSRLFKKRYGKSPTSFRK